MDERVLFVMRVCFHTVMMIKRNEINSLPCAEYVKLRLRGKVRSLEK